MFSTTADIIVSDFVKFLFVLSVDRISFSKEHSIRGYYTELFRFSGNNFKLNWLEVSSYDKQISLFDWSVSVLEIRNQVGLGQITSKPLNGVLER